VPEVIASPEPEQEMQVQEAIAQPDETAIIEIEVVPEVIASPEPEQEMQVQEAIAQPDETAIIEIEVVPEVLAAPEPEQEMQVQEAIAQPDETAIIEIEVVPEVLAAPEPEQKINEIDSQSNNQVSETVESLEIGIDADPSDSTEMNIVSDFSENIPVNDEYHIEPEQVLVSEEIISIVETEINKGNISETNDIMPANAADEHNDTDQVILIESTSEAENIIQTVDDSAYSSNIENESIQIAEQFLVSESPSVTEEHTNVKRYNLSVDILIQECSRIQNSLGKFVILGNEFNENSEYTYSDFDYLFASNHALTAFAASIGLII
ncbi:MAG: hypothetical protein NT007_05145, partial [Candidatus Kapabacteria bacterium]|nr:hypothetical protein [Candidatus Kapabacteria bacterium]